MARLSKHNKKPQHHRTTEEIVSDLKNNADFLMRMKFIKEHFYPALIDASQNIEDASVLLTGFNNTMMEGFLGSMKEKKVRDLNLESKLDSQSPKYEQNKKLLDLFQDMDIFQAKEYIEGMKNEIEVFKKDFFENKPLSELPTRWLDEIKKYQ